MDPLLSYFNATVNGCQYVHRIVGYEERCHFVQYNSDCNSSLSLIDYARFIYCGFMPEHELMAIFISIVWMCLLFVALAVTATDFLCPSLFVISKALHLSQNVAGATLVAFGNGSVDIFAAISGIRQGRPDLVIGDLLGGGTFVTMFVVGSLFALKPFKLLAWPFVRDIIFYLLGISFIFYLFIFAKEIKLYGGIGLLGLYVLYVIVVAASGKIGENGGVVHGHGSSKKNEESIIFEGITPDVDPEASMVVMKGFVMVSDRPVTRRYKGQDDNLCQLKPSNLIPIIKVTPDDGSLDNLSTASELKVALAEPKKYGSRVSILEDNSVYSTVTSFTDIIGQLKRSRASSIFSISQTQRLQIRRASKEFLEKITPIDVMTWRRQNWSSRSLEIIKSPIRFFLLLTTPMADVEEKNEWNKILSSMHCVTGPVFTVYALGFGDVWMFNCMPLPLLILVVAAFISFLIIFTSSFETPPTYYNWYASILSFMVSTTWIYSISNEVISVIRTIGVAFDITEITIGMTLLAWGNCFLDFVANIAIARKGYPQMAIAACIGAPLLSLLIGVGTPVTIQLAKDSHTQILLYPGELIIVVYGALLLGLVSTLIVSMITRFRADRIHGFLLVTLYFVLIAVVGLMEKKIFTLGYFKLS